MRDFKVGDKVYLECEVKQKDISDNTYILGYEDYTETTACATTIWVKDDVLHAPDDAYNKGLNDAWELMRKIVGSPSDGGYTFNELVEIFGMVNKPIFDVYTLQEALAKVKEYEERNEINVGDVVRSKGCSLESIVTNNRCGIYRLFKDGSCNSTKKEDLVKTGKHYDSIDEFMKQKD